MRSRMPEESRSDRLSAWGIFPRKMNSWMNLWGWLIMWKRWESISPHPTAGSRRRRCLRTFCSTGWCSGQGSRNCQEGRGDVSICSECWWARPMSWFWTSLPIIWTSRHWRFWRIIWIGSTGSSLLCHMTGIFWTARWTVSSLLRGKGRSASLKADIPTIWSAGSFWIRRRVRFPGRVLRGRTALERRILTRLRCAQRRAPGSNMRRN